MLSTYRDVLSYQGSWRFSVAAVVARLPLSMVGLGIVLLVSSTTGSYGLAGSVSATYLVANAALSVVQGRLLDRFGQARPLVVTTAAFAAALLTMAWSASSDRPLLLTYAAAAVAGASLPPVGACVRARWAHVLTNPRRLHTAYSLESVLDEVVFVTGPIIVTGLATAWHPLAGLAAAVTFAVVGTVALAAHRASQPPPRGHQTHKAHERPMPWPAMAAIAVVCLALGGLFGGAEVSAVAFTDERGVRSLAGVLLAVWSAGSLVAGLVTGIVRWRRGPGARLRGGAVAMAAAMAPLPWIHSLPLLGVVMFVGGFAIAPTLIALNSLTEQTVPRERLVEGMAIVHTGIAAGVAPGAALAGHVIDARGASVAFLVPLASGVIAAVASLAAPR